MSEAYLPAQHAQAIQEARFPPSDGDPSRSGHSQEPPSQGPPQAVGLIWRIDRRATFRALRAGRRGRSGPLTVSWVAGDPTEPPRVAYTIGKRVGPAVVRNRVRRRLRTCVRDAAPRLLPGAYLIGVSPDAAHLSYEELRMTLQRALDAVTSPPARSRPPATQERRS